jgi:hypothetical protein
VTHGLPTTSTIPKMLSGEFSPLAYERASPNMMQEILQPLFALGNSSPVSVRRPAIVLRATSNPQHMFSPHTPMQIGETPNVHVHLNLMLKVTPNVPASKNHAQIQIVAEEAMTFRNVLPTAAGSRANTHFGGRDHGISIFLLDNAHEPTTYHPHLTLHMPDSPQPLMQQRA